MPFTVQQIINDLRKPVTADLDESVQLALDRMLNDDFSQLPVVKDTGQDAQFYLITTDSILTKLHAFGDKLADTKLQVKDVLVKVPRVFLPYDDLSEVLQALRDSPAILVVNAEHQLINIVTPYDTTVYFRRWSEDMMRARDIENSLKEYINEAFKTSDGKIDMAARQYTIEEIKSENRKLRKKFELAVNKYLGEQAKDAVAINSEWAGQAFLDFLSLIGMAEQPITASGLTPGRETDPLSATMKLKQSFESALQKYLIQRAATESKCQDVALDMAFTLLFDKNEKSSDFNDLTLWDFVQLFFHRHCWDRCYGVFDKEKQSIEFMLDGVRKTRNKLAHFRDDEITAQDRAQLRACAEFLQDHEKRAKGEFERTARQPSVSEETTASEASI